GTDHSEASAGTTSRCPWISRASAPGSLPSNRATTLVRPGALSWTTGSSPTSASFSATYSAATRSPTLVSLSPVLVVSMRSRSWQICTTSSVAFICSSYHLSGSGSSGLLRLARMKLPRAVRYGRHGGGHDSDRQPHHDQHRRV